MGSECCYLCYCSDSMFVLFTSHTSKATLKVSCNYFYFWPTSEAPGQLWCVFFFSPLSLCIRYCAVTIAGAMAVVLNDFTPQESVCINSCPLCPVYPCQSSQIKASKGYLGTNPWARSQILVFLTVQPAGVLMKWSTSGLACMSHRQTRCASKKNCFDRTKQKKIQIKWWLTPDASSTRCC